MVFYMQACKLILLNFINAGKREDSWVRGKEQYIVYHMSKVVAKILSHLHWLSESHSSQGDAQSQRHLNTGLVALWERHLELWGLSVSSEQTCLTFAPEGNVFWMSAFCGCGKIMTEINQPKRKFILCCMLCCSGFWSPGPIAPEFLVRQNELRESRWSKAIYKLVSSGNQKKRRQLASQYPWWGHAPSDLTSFH